MKAITIYQLPDGSFIACKTKLTDLAFLVPPGETCSPENLTARQFLGDKYASYSDWDASMLAVVVDYLKKPLDTPA